MNRLTIEDSSGLIHLKDNVELNTAVNKLSNYEDLEKALNQRLNGCVSVADVIKFFIKFYDCEEKDRGTAEALLLVNDDVFKYHEWKRLEEQGKLLKLPCTVGDAVYVLRIDNVEYMMNDEKVWEIVEERFEIRHFDCIGKTVFLTRKEAETALKKLERG